VNLGKVFAENNLYLAVAESLTAGLVTADFTSTPGASNYLLGGIVCYQNSIKIHQLGVDAELIAGHGPVDPAVAVQLAQGVRSRFARDCAIPAEQVVGLSTTGVAGPDAVGDKPVGLVYLGISSARGDRAIELQLAGSRSEIRLATVASAKAAIADEIHLLLG
jgi:nicotinamide-nucleotide amidase